jgi:hypothetical protein
MQLYAPIWIRSGLFWISNASARCSVLPQSNLEKRSVGVSIRYQKPRREARPPLTGVRHEMIEGHCPILSGEAGSLSDAGGPIAKVDVATMPGDVARK